MDTRWFQLLVELADRGTLRAAAQASGYSTSAVSQQLAALQKAMGAALVEPDGRRLRLTPAGRALLPYARKVLSIVDDARGLLEAGGTPAGLVRVAGFATALLSRVVPAVTRLRHEYPDLSVTMEEREPDEVFALLAEDAVDVGLVYEYSLVPHGIAGVPFVTTPMALVVPPAENRSPEEILADPASRWITNSRYRDDDELIRRVGARLSIDPHITHRIDSLDLVVELVCAGLGFALITDLGLRLEGVQYVDLEGLAGTRTGYALTRPGRENWPANTVLIKAIQTSSWS